MVGEIYIIQKNLLFVSYGKGMDAEVLGFHSCMNVLIGQLLHF